VLCSLASFFSVYFCIGGLRHRQQQEGTQRTIGVNRIAAAFLSVVVLLFVFPAFIDSFFLHSP
jgi:Ca2+/H+ antiporter